MSTLSDIAKKRNPYLSLEVEESAIVTYKGFKMVPSSFDPTKENYRFLLELDGQTKFWDTGSNRVALAFDKIKEGTKVVITKHSAGTDKNGKQMYNWEVEPEVSEKK